MTAAQPLLFAEPLGPSPEPSERPKRGRGATPLVEFEFRGDIPNPCGRSKLTFRYRPLKRHSIPYRTPTERGSLLAPRSSILEVARDLLQEYFQLVGGFRLVDDAIMTAWADALDLYTPKEIRWAIAAKAASLASDDPNEQRLKRMYVPRPDNFPAYLSTWLDKSPAYQQHVERQRARQQRFNLDEELRHRQAAEQQAAAQSAQALTALKTHREQEAQQAQSERDQLAAAYWDTLSDQQRWAACKAVKPEFEQYCENMGASSEEPKQDMIYRMWCIDWARKQWPPEQT